MSYRVIALVKEGRDVAVVSLGAYEDRGKALKALARERRLFNDDAYPPEVLDIKVEAVSDGPGHANPEPDESRKQKGR